LRFDLLTFASVADTLLLVRFISPSSGVQEFNTMNIEKEIGRAILEGTPAARTRAIARATVHAAVVTRCFCECGNILDERTSAVIEVTIKNEEELRPLAVFCSKCLAKHLPKLQSTSKDAATDGTHYYVTTWNGSEKVTEPSPEPSPAEPRAKTVRQILAGQDAVMWHLANEYGVVSDRCAMFIFQAALPISPPRGMVRDREHVETYARVAERQKTHGKIFDLHLTRSELSVETFLHNGKNTQATCRTFWTETPGGKKVRARVQESYVLTAQKHFGQSLAYYVTAEEQQRLIISDLKTARVVAVIACIEIP
jgi:hypothetical protein